MRCAICDSRLPVGQKLTDDICPVCAHIVRRTLGLSEGVEEFMEYEYTNGKMSK